MFISFPTLGGLLLLSSSALANPIAGSTPSKVQSTPDLVARNPGLGPSAYPYGDASDKEFQWHGWDPQDQGQKARGQKIHNAWLDWANMVYFARQEAAAVSPTFLRWFGAGDADNVKAVFDIMFDSSGLGVPTTLMAGWICKESDVQNSCTSSRNAYSVTNRGQFHFCPAGDNLPNLGDLKCSDLDPFPSAKMKSVAFTMLHESTHWVKTGDAALGKHITDKANAAYACTKLSDSDKLINAQNYAFLAAEAYFKRKGCTFGDPESADTSDTGDDGDDIEGTGYAPGWCGLHVIDYQIPKGGSFYSIEADIFDNTGVPIGYQPETDAQNTINIDSALPIPLQITRPQPGSSSDPDTAVILFNYGSQAWGSDDQAHQCNFGGDQDGSRSGDCGFSC